MSGTDLDARTIADAIETLSGAPVSDRDRSRDVRTYANGRVEWSSHEREVYSYGRHFPLVRFVPRKLSGARRDLFLVNGDIWRQQGPSRTREHQAATRMTVSRACALTGARSLVVPFSALNGAGIDLDSIRPIDVRDDANWTETREARTLAELPRHERQTSYSVTREAAELDWIPADYRRTWTEKGYGDREPDADGIYRWQETRYRDREPDDDGRYRWEVTVHRLGDSLFSAVRAERETRDAFPLETEHDTARETVRLRDSEGRTYCTADSAPDSSHVAGPAGACIYCGLALRADVTYRRRARYLSSFDYQENPPLYFLCEVPRGAGDTVETAIDRLAPRVVHAAIARGREVARQGDVFFIDTDLTREDLAARGATFARLTQWTRGAAPRPGEVNYARPLSAAERRAAYARETAYARRLWRETFRAELQRAVFDAGAHERNAAARAESRAQWRELLDRHERETAAAGPDALVACETCGADVGAPCSREQLQGFELGGYTRWPRGATADGYCRGDGYGHNGAAARAPERTTLAERHARERSDLARETARKRRDYARPETGAGERARARIVRERATAAVETARAALRRATLAGDARPSSTWDYGYSPSPPTRHVRAIAAARETLSDARDRLRSHELGAPGSGARDAYRNRFGENAAAAWRRARLDAAIRYRAHEIANTPAADARRERIRRALAIYGTAHSATEVARVNGAVYARGIVRHEPALETGRGGDRDHRPVTLTADRWYLAVRNTVPRQTRRRRRVRARA